MPSDPLTKTTSPACKSAFIGAIITSLVLAFVLGPSLINWLRSKQSEGQPIRDDGPESHLLTKKGTPTMGGLLLLLCTSIGTLLWADISSLCLGGTARHHRLWLPRFP